MAEEQLDENERIRPREQASNQKHDNWHLKAVKPATQLIFFFYSFYRKKQKRTKANGAFGGGTCGGCAK